jgi:hypothetical protein
MADRIYSQQKTVEVQTIRPFLNHAPDISPSSTPSITPTISVTPSISKTPSVTPSNSPSSSPPPTPTPSFNPYYLAEKYNCRFNRCNQFIGQSIVYAGGVSLNTGLFYTASSTPGVVYQIISITNSNNSYVTVNTGSFNSCDEACLGIVPTPTPTKTPSVTPTPTVTKTPSVTPTKTPSVTPSITPSVTVTHTPSVTISVTPTKTPSVTVTPTITLTPSVTLTVTPTKTPTVSVTPSLTNTPYITPTNTPVPTQTPSRTPPTSLSPTPTITPTPSVSCAKPGGLTTKKLWISFEDIKGTINYISTFDYNFACNQYYSLYIGGTNGNSTTYSAEASSWVIGQKVYISGGTSCMGIASGAYWLTETATSIYDIIDAAEVDIVIIDSNGYITDITNCTPY